MQMTDIVAPESVRKDVLVLARSKIMRGRLSEGVDVTAETMCFFGRVCGGGVGVSWEGNGCPTVFDDVIRTPGMFQKSGNWKALGCSMALMDMILPE